MANQTTRSNADRSNEKNIYLNSDNATSGIGSSYKPKMQWLVLKSGLLYFSIVFGVGFVLGSIRVFWVVPHFGTRIAELIEMPLMLIAIILAARWLARRLAIPPVLWIRLGMGLVGLCFLLIAEFGAVLYLRGMTIAEYFATRDPVSGTLYYAMLGVFAVMPWLVSQKRTL
jgi:hypothetical protein